MLVDVDLGLPQGVNQDRVAHFIQHDVCAQLRVQPLGSRPGSGQGRAQEGIAGQGRAGRGAYLKYWVSTISHQARARSTARPSGSVHCRNKPVSCSSHSGSKGGIVWSLRGAGQYPKMEGSGPPTHAPIFWASARGSEEGHRSHYW